MKISYTLENRQEVIEQIMLAGQIIVQDVAITLVAESPTDCYFIVMEAPPADPPPAGGDTEEMEDMQAALEMLGVVPGEGGV